MDTAIQRRFEVQATGLILVKNLPITVEPNEAFAKAKLQLQQMVMDGITTIQSDEDYALATEQFDKINKFLKDLERGIKSAKDDLNTAKNQLLAFIHELDEPATKLKNLLAAERARYARWKDEQIEAERRRKEEEARKEAARQQQEIDMLALLDEIYEAENEALAAAERKQEITAREIDRMIPKRAEYEVSQDLIGIANRLRQAVADAKQREATRIALAEAKSKQEREVIAKQTIEAAPVTVEAIQTQKVEAAPVQMTLEPALPKLKGEKTITYWRVKQDERGRVVGIVHPSAVPRAFCEPSVRLLDEYAKTCQGRPVVEGVEFEEVNKMSAYGK